MNYLDYIENDTRKPNELKEFFKSKYPDHYYLMAESDTKSDWWGETSGVSICVEMYLIAYIHIKKPMTILEYGSGKSTYIMSKVMTDLNYGGRLIAYEDNEDWYKRNKDLGLYENAWQSKSNDNNIVIGLNKVLDDNEFDKLVALFDE